MPSLSSRRPVALAFWRGAELVIALLSVKPPWWGVDGADSSMVVFFNKRMVFFSCYIVVDLELLPPLPLACRGGEGWKRGFWISLSTAWWWSVSMLHPRANFATDKLAVAISGRYGGPSSTSVIEALLALLWSSTSRCCQVVRPRRRRVGQRQWYFAGNECTSTKLFGFGAFCAWRSPAICGGVVQAPDCFFSFCARDLFVRPEALFSNIRFFRASVVKGPPCKCTCHV